MIKSPNVAGAFSPFELELVEDRQELITFGFTQEIFDTLVFDIDKQIEKFESETKELKQFLSEINESNDPKKDLSIFKKHRRTYHILSDILWKYGKDYHKLIDYLKQPYVGPKSLQRYLQEENEKNRKQEDIEKFLRYVKAYGKYEYAIMEAGKKLIELGIAEEREQGKNRHMIEEKGEDEGTIVFTSKENHITIPDLPENKTPYYKKKITGAWKDFLNQPPPEEPYGPF
ncbi:MAG: hypothetical protein WC875_03100 [Candidatus Absconditabacterales bacterium]